MAITGTETETSPRIIYSGSTRTVERTYKYQYQEDWESEMPDEGDLESDGYVIRWEAIRETPVYTLVKIIYSSSESWSPNWIPSDGDTVYYVESRGIETPLEMHTGFKMLWTYDLYQAVGFNQALQGWASTATDASDALNNDWLWSKTNPGREKWVLVQERTKPGNEMYLKPTVVVRQEDYHRIKATAEDELSNCGYLVTPSEVFGYTTGTWLVSSVDLHHDDKYWIATQEYMHSIKSATGAGWDTDIYSAPPP